MKRCQKVWAGPSPPLHWCKIQKNSSFFFVENVPYMMTLSNCNGYSNISGNPVLRMVMSKMRFKLGSIAPTSE